MCTLICRPFFQLAETNVGLELRGVVEGLLKFLFNPIDLPVESGEFRGPEAGPLVLFVPIFLLFFFRVRFCMRAVVGVVFVDKVNAGAVNAGRSAVFHESPSALAWREGKPRGPGL